MHAADRRLGFRVPLEIFLNQYIMDQPFRALTANVSDTGFHLQLVNRPDRTPTSRRSRVVGLEFELPGTNEIVWARGLICYAKTDDLVHSIGVKFTAMPRIHARMIRDFCVETRRTHLGKMLERIRATN